SGARGWAIGRHLRRGRARPPRVSWERAPNEKAKSGAREGEALVALTARFDPPIAVAIATSRHTCAGSMSARRVPSWPAPPPWWSCPRGSVRREAGNDATRGAGLRRGASVHLCAFDEPLARDPRLRRAGRGRRGRGAGGDSPADPEPQDAAPRNAGEGRDMTSQVSVRITGVGVEIPPDVITSAEIEERAALRQRFHLEPGWLEHVTGVQTRRWAPSHVQPSELATAAGTKALRSAGVDPLDVDTLIFAGITRDCLEPAT